MSVYPVQSDQGFTPSPPIIPTLRPQFSEEAKLVGANGRNDGDSDDKKAASTPVAPTTNSQGQVIGSLVNIAV